MKDQLTEVTLEYKPEAMNEKPTYYTTEELFKIYPTIEERGWTVEYFEAWVNQDIIIGKFSAGKKKKVLVEKESLEAFIKYHNEFLLERNRRVQEGIEADKRSSKR